MKERGNRILKLIDRYAGIPLVCFLGLIKKKRILNSNYFTKKNPKIILLKTAAIGDTILLSSIVAEIKNIYPNAEISILCSKNNLSAASFIAPPDNVIVFNISNPLKGLCELIDLPEYDLLLDFAPWARLNAIISFFISARLKIGFKRENMYRHYIYDLVVEHSDNIHEIENYRNILRAINILPKGLPANIEINRNKKDIVNNFLEDNKHYIIFHPFPGGEKKELKEWPDDNWIKLGQHLVQSGYSIVITGGKEDTERANYLARKISEDKSASFAVAGEISLSETAELIMLVGQLISVNTGIMHLGASVGANVIALNGPTSSLRWGPLGKKSISINAKCKCAPCLSLGFEYACSHGGCMSTITVNDVSNSIPNFT